MMPKRVLILFIVLLLTLASCRPSPAPLPTLTLLAASPTIAPTTAAPTPTATATPAPTATSSPAPQPTPTSTPAAPVAPFWGVHVNRLSEQSQINVLQQVGARWTRFDRFRWNEIEPQNVDPSGYRWNASDEAGLALASQSGLQVIAALLFTPEWAQKYPGVLCGPVAESAFEEYGQYLQALVRRYGQPPFNVRYWELGNEPDIDYRLVPPDSPFGCWGDSEDPYYGGEYYGEMLKVVYPMIKQADPQAQVLVGGLVLDCDPVDPPEDPPGSGKLRDCTSTRFLEGILKTGAGSAFDGVSFHAYDYYYGEAGKYGSSVWRSAWDLTGPVLAPKVRYLRALLSAYEAPDKALFNTEVALLCGRDGTEDPCRQEDFLQTKAAYLAQANAAALAEGLDANIWYSLTGWRASQLVYMPALRPQPALEAFAFNVQQLQDAVYLGEVNEYAGVKGYRWQQQDQEIWLLWSLDGETHEIRLQFKPSSYLDLYGNPLEIPQGEDTAITVGLPPVYLGWQAGAAP